jgi:hypothetical protein
MTQDNDYHPIVSLTKLKVGLEEYNLLEISYKDVAYEIDKTRAARYLRPRLSFGTNLDYL